ncbi:MAG: hypothetical protein JSS83_23345 [Cyanobacteria bacterium SZAS LIN-3]|nr:hypothetical protein [Cyanobacteria bacterium SZAS LIN-3]
MSIELTFFLFKVFVFVVVAVVGLVFLIRKQHDRKLDSPERMYFRMPAPRLYALVKKVIFRFRLMEYHFQVVEADSTTLSLRTVCEWRDRTFRTMPLLAPEGYVFSQVILDVQVGSDRERGSFLELSWIVLDGPLRAKGNLIQATLTRSIHEALADVQSVRS